MSYFTDKLYYRQIVRQQLKQNQINRQKEEESKKNHLQEMQRMNQSSRQEPRPPIPCSNGQIRLRFTFPDGKSTIINAKLTETLNDIETQLKEQGFIPKDSMNQFILLPSLIIPHESLNQSFESLKIENRSSFHVEPIRTPESVINETGNEPVFKYQHRTQFPISADKVLSSFLPV